MEMSIVNELNFMSRMKETTPCLCGIMYGIKQFDERNYITAIAFPLANTTLIDLPSWYPTVHSGNYRDHMWPAASQIFTALKYIHERDMIHYDIKPANIFVFLDGQYSNNVPLLKFVIGDYGLCEDVRSPVLPENVVTRAYRNPELLQRRLEHKTWADIHAACQTLYEFLTRFSSLNFSTDMEIFRELKRQYAFIDQSVGCPFSTFLSYGFKTPTATAREMLDRLALLKQPVYPIYQQRALKVPRRPTGETFMDMFLSSTEGI